MSEDTTTDRDHETAETATTDVEKQRVPYERFQQANSKAQGSRRARPHARARTR
jgi:hypothetical protein